MKLYPAAAHGLPHVSLSVKSLSCFIAIASVLVAGCQRMPSIPGLTPYKIDIQQGNYVTQDMVEKLKPGMTKSQVRFALGTPLVTDAFHPDRWDYVYSLQKQGRVAEQRRIVVVFADDKLLRIEGDVKPAATSAAAPAAAAPAPPAAAAAPPAPAPAPKPADKPVAAQ